MLPTVNDLPKLGSPVADVIVGDHLVSQKARDPREAVSEDRAPDVPDMHRLRDIRGAEVHENFLRGSCRRNPQPGIGGQRLDAGRNEIRLQTEIQKSGTRHFGRGRNSRDIDFRKNIRSELARIYPALLRKNHGGI